MPCQVEGCLHCSEDPAVCLTCVEGLYYDLKLRQCIPCHKSCATCSGPAHGDCHLCPFIKRQQTHSYTSISDPFVSRRRQHLVEKFPELDRLPMLFSKVFHPYSDTYCIDGDQCKHSKDDFYTSEQKTPLSDEANYGNGCPDLDTYHEEDHSVAVAGMADEFDQGHSYDDYLDKGVRREERRDKLKKQREVEDSMRAKEEEAHFDQREEYKRAMEAEM